jgi:hypothetical protein
VAYEKMKPIDGTVFCISCPNYSRYVCGTEYSTGPYIVLYIRVFFTVYGSYSVLGIYTEATYKSSRSYLLFVQFKIKFRSDFSNPRFVFARVSCCPS